MPKKNIPSYRLHKPTGQAIVSLKGKMFYLGKYKSQASREKYTQLIAEYTANDCKLPPTRNQAEVSVEKLIFAYLEYAESYYLSVDGRQSDSFCLRSTVCRLFRPCLFVKMFGKFFLLHFGQ